MFEKKFIPKIIMPEPADFAKSILARERSGLYYSLCMQEILPSVWQAKGNLSGPTLTIMGGTHGNEDTGIQVVMNLKEKIDHGEIFIKAGTLNLILGNPRAVEIHERGSAPHQDLNRCFYLDILTRVPDGTYEEQRARELAPILKGSDFLIDLHATNKPSEPFLACKISPKHQELYQWYPCKKILIDQNSIIGGKPVTTEEYAEAYGVIAICFETGQAGDTSRVEQVEKQTMDVLKHYGFVEGEPDEPQRLKQDVFELVEAIMLTEDGFTFSNGFGEASWKSFEAGTIIGYHGHCPVQPTYHGVIVFPKLKEHRILNKPVGYLAKQIM